MMIKRNLDTVFRYRDTVSCSTAFPGRRRIVQIAAATKTMRWRSKRRPGKADLHIIHTLLAGISLILCGSLHGDEPLRLIQRYCIDCHGAPDESPERGFSLNARFDSASLAKTGPTLKKALDAIEGYEMPPTDSEQPSTEERKQLVDGIRKWLANPDTELPQHERPILRRLTRLEYNNTVRDLLGLDTDVFMFSERLPFDKTYFQPESGKMPSRLNMRAREYGGKYPVLLPGAGLPGDSRAEHGFSNRGDAQDTSAVLLEQYVSLGQQIMRHPDLLTRAWRLLEIFPEASYQPPVVSQSAGGKQLVESVAMFAPNNNIVSEASANPYTLAAFRARLTQAFAEDRGGVYDVGQNKGATIPGKGGALQIAYGDNATRFIELNPSEDIWNVPFATAEESSGDALFANKVKGLKKFFFGIGTVKGKAGGGVTELGIVVLSRRGQTGTVRLNAEFGNDESEVREVELTEGAGKDNTFVCFKAPEGRSIRRLAIDGSDFTGDYVLLDDLAFITRDPPAGKDLLVGVEPAQKEESTEASSTKRLERIDLSIAQKSPRERLDHFMRRAFRRPVFSDEVELYFSLYDSAVQRGAHPADAMKDTLAGVLASPHFLFVNIDTSPDHQLASNLSYFLWSSMPDDELIKLADAGQLSNPEVLEAQARRMLKSDRVRELSENFYVEWLRLRELWSSQPDARAYKPFYAGPMGKETLADDMFAEALLLFESILIEDRPIVELLDTDYTFVNAALASRLYEFGDLPKLELADSGEQIGPLSENEMKSASNWYRVRLPDHSRGGVMTMGATLTLTSFPTRTSPIKRGVWLLDTVFNRPPPPPTIAVADIDAQEFDAELTVREKTRLHRDKAACAVCHNRIDPPGFALESFDGIGRIREKDGSQVIDDSGVIPGGSPFDGPAEFKRQLLHQKERFVRGFTEKMLSYALCRDLDYFDDPTVNRIVNAAAKDDFRLSRIIVEIVRSDAFRTPQGREK